MRYYVYGRFSLTLHVHNLNVLCEIQMYSYGCLLLVFSVPLKVFAVGV